MPRWVEVNIEGLKELEQTLEELQVKSAQRILKFALKKAATRVKEMFAALAPVKSGLLSHNFKIKMKTKKDNIAATAIIAPAGDVYYPRAARDGSPSSEGDDSGKE